MSKYSSYEVSRQATPFEGDAISDVIKQLYDDSKQFDTIERSYHIYNNSGFIRATLDIDSEGNKRLTVCKTDRVFENEELANYINYIEKKTEVSRNESTSNRK